MEELIAQLELKKAQAGKYSAWFWALGAIFFVALGTLLAILLQRQKPRRPSSVVVKEVVEENKARVEAREVELEAIREELVDLYKDEQATAQAAEVAEEKVMATDNWDALEAIKRDL